MKIKLLALSLLINVQSVVAATITPITFLADAYSSMESGSLYDFGADFVDQPISAGTGADAAFGIGDELSTRLNWELLPGGFNVDSSAKFEFGSPFDSVNALSFVAIDYLFSVDKEFYVGIDGAIEGDSYRVSFFKDNDVPIFQAFTDEPLSFQAILPAGTYFFQYRVESMFDISDAAETVVRESNLNLTIVPLPAGLPLFLSAMGFLAVWRKHLRGGVAV